MWNRAGKIVGGALRDLARAWRPLALADIAFKALAFALLTPAVVLLLHWMLRGATGGVVADADIARVILTTREGLAALVLGGSLFLTITCLEAAGLMAIGLEAAKGAPLSARRAIRFGAARAPNVLRLSAHMVVRLLAGLVPFLLALGALYWALLRQYDINYYLAERPPAFWISVGLAAPMAAALAALIVWTISRWALALPLLLFEGVAPRRALGESARRSSGSRMLVVTVLALWGGVALVLISASQALVEVVGRWLAPHMSGSLALLLAFVTGLAILWAVLGIAVAIANISLVSLLLVRLYLHASGHSEASLPVNDGDAYSWRLSGRARVWLSVAVVMGAVGFALTVFFIATGHRPVAVVAHRGASAAAPENTLAAFRLAIDQGADYVELDVQESADGQVLVVHDSDLMKVGGVAMKIWETDAATLRTVDIGSHAGPQFSAERIATLAEALAVCKGRSRVIVELKSYGHNQRLEERVAGIVEEAGMADACVFMSLDHDMVRTMKRLRPSWRCGVLVAKALGDLTSLHADFLAVEQNLATPRFVRRAHRARQEVYVWTVNDPARMLGAMSRGVDGLITDRPDIAREAVNRRARMSDAQRLLVALLVRFGARSETLLASEALRP